MMSPFARLAVLTLALGLWPALANANSDPWQTEVIVAAPVKPARVETGSTAPAPTAGPRPSLTGKVHALDGIASYYWQEQMTASGEIFDKRAMTAAHPTLPFGTLVEVINLGNGKRTKVRINDRGPFKPGRIIDVSEAAAEELGMQARGLAPVKIVVLGR